MEAVLAVPVAMGIGYLADDYFGTEPRYLLIGTVIGFGSFVLRLLRMRKLIEDPMTPPIDMEAARLARNTNTSAGTSPVESTENTPEHDDFDLRPLGLVGQDEDEDRDRQGRREGLRRDRREDRQEDQKVDRQEGPQEDEQGPR